MDVAQMLAHLCIANYMVCTDQDPKPKGLMKMNMLTIPPLHIVLVIQLNGESFGKGMETTKRQK